MALLDEVFSGQEGVARWRTLSRFTVHFSISGSLLARKGKAAAATNGLVAEGVTRPPSLRLVGLRDAGAPVDVGSDRITKDRQGVTVAQVQEGLRGSVDGHTSEMPWDDLSLGYFCAVSLWTCLTVPLRLAAPGVTLEMSGAWQRHAQGGPRLLARFPETVPGPSVQMLELDRDGLLQRMDYATWEGGGEPVTHLASAHQAFAGIVVPTLHRCLPRRQEGAVATAGSQMDLEIFDARFD